MSDKLHVADQKSSLKRMNKMRMRFKEMAENHSMALQGHLGELFDSVWEVVRTCSRVTDRCLSTETALDDEKCQFLLLLLRNSLSDCCCCLDATERGHERTVFNNLRMILEDTCCAIHASEDQKVLKCLYDGKYQASNSITFAKKHYSGHEIGKLYGFLSKVSHHSMQELVVRQWVNRDGLLSHLKPFNPERMQAQLNVLSLVTHLARIIGEVAEKVCLDELQDPYFWNSSGGKKQDPPIDAIVFEISEKISKIMNK